VLTVHDLDDLAAHAGAELGVSAWRVVSQDDIDAFAALTGDHQWIHVDVERARSGPFGGTIAHGFLVLSLLPVLATEVVAYADDLVRVNYGLDRVRFPGPVRAGSRVRDRVTLVSATTSERGTLVTTSHRIEVEGQERPGAAADYLTLLPALTNAPGAPAPGA
jgi:acyl dehydratase